jgi:hypothetical protein
MARLISTGELQDRRFVAKSGVVAAPRFSLFGRGGTLCAPWSESAETACRAAGQISVLSRKPPARTLDRIFGPGDVIDLNPSQVYQSTTGLKVQIMRCSTPRAPC